MRFKPGVPDVPPSEGMKRGREILRSLFESTFDQDLRITSTTDGKHRRDSKHYDSPHNAEDYGFPEPFRSFLWLVKKELGPDYDLVVEQDHIHLEFDRKS